MSFVTAMAEWAAKHKQLVADAVRSEAPVGKTRQLDLFGGTGESQTLASSIHGRAIGRVGMAAIHILSPLNYSVIIKEGRAEVRPVKAQALHWIGDDGEDVFRMVSGAVAPNPYPQRAWERVGKQVKRDLEKRMSEEGVRQIRKSIKLGGLF